MATTQGDIAKPTLPIGERRDTRKNDMLAYVESINKINAERTKRYFDLAGKPTMHDKSRDGIVRRVVPKKG